MNKSEKEIYLSELFLEALDGNFCLEAVLKVLKKCDEQILCRLKLFGGAEKNSILQSGVGDIKIPGYMQQEYLDFWDVYKEFDNMLSMEMKKNYFILQVI